MKTKKERLREFSHRFFLSFSPDALHPVDGILPPARGAGASGASNSQNYNLLLQMGFCVFLGGDTTIP
ncbi:MAG: hypothetical protein IJN44_03670, partial [Clostridia bacterium]|nr:hypothetical protein [Clostridia bacterium]